MAGKRILIVDDDPDTVSYLSAWLEDNGYEAHSASDGRLGMDAIVELDPDLVLMDLKMPNQTGLHLYKQICDTAVYAELPVIIITGVAEFELFGEGCRPLPEPAARIEKPPDLEILGRAIRQALSS